MLSAALPFPVALSSLSQYGNCHSRTTSPSGPRFSKSRYNQITSLFLTARYHFFQIRTDNPVTHLLILCMQASTSRDVEAAEPGPVPDDVIRLPESLPGWKYDGILYFSRLLSFVTATAAVMCAVIHGLAAYRSFKYHGDVSMFPRRILLDDV